MGGKLADDGVEVKINLGRSTWDIFGGCFLLTRFLSPGKLRFQIMKVSCRKVTRSSYCVEYLKNIGKSLDPLLHQTKRT